MTFSHFFFSFFLSLQLLSRGRWRCNKSPVDNNGQQCHHPNGMEQNVFSLRHIVQSSSEKGLTAEQKSRLQKHTLTCKHKSPSLSLDLRFPPSVVRSATEPFPAYFPHDNKNITFNSRYLHFSHFFFFLLLHLNFEPVSRAGLVSLCPSVIKALRHTLSE